MRSADRSSPAELWSPRSSGVGGGKLAVSTFSSAGSTPTRSSCAPPRAQHQQLGIRAGLHDPFAAARTNQYTWGDWAASGTLMLTFWGSFRGRCRTVYLSPGPKMLRWAETVACQSPL